jgi:hypothetical protein
MSRKSKRRKRKRKKLKREQQKILAQQQPPARPKVSTARLFEIIGSLAHVTRDVIVESEQ